MATSTARKKVDLPPNVEGRDVPPDQVPPFMDGSPITDSPTFASVQEAVEDQDKPKSNPETVRILKSLQQTYSHLGIAVSLISTQDGIHIVQNSGKLTESWRQVLDNDPKLRKKMLGVIQGSGWGAVIFAHIAVFAPIANNHRDKFSHLVTPRRSRNVVGETAPEL
jgi:hypothetical protein